MPEVNKIALFQEWPKKTIKGLVKMYYSSPKATVKVFSGDRKGLEEAIEATERSDAKLIRLQKDYFTSDDLLEFIREQIQKDQFVLVYQPIYKMPKGQGEDNDRTRAA